MAGIDKLATPIGDRPLLAWTLAALAAAPGGRPDRRRRGRRRRGDVRAATWLPAKVVAVVAGGDRRQDSVAAGFAALDRWASRRRSRGPRPRRRATGGLGRARRRGRPGGGGPRRRDPGRADRRDAQAARRRVGRRHRRPPRARRGPDAAGRPAGSAGRAFGRVPEAPTAVWTDEAALLEACRIPVHAIPGEPTNLKVTMPDDLGRAELVLLGARPTRFGFGDDSHPFGPGEPLALGGIAIDGAPRLHGHSDGDVALHAVADALLGAAGLGDLGRIFPAGPATPRGIASGELVQEVVRRLAANGLRPAPVDLTIVGARPRLGDRLDGMRRRSPTCSGWPPIGSTSRRRPATWPASRAPVAASPPGPSRSSSRSDDRPPARHADRGAA